MRGRGSSPYFARKTRSNAWLAALASVLWLSACGAPSEESTNGLESDRIRDLSRETNVPILLVGLDGADWQIAEPLMRNGLLPNLAALRERGAWGNVKALTPILSPLLWTSVATGVTADRHGVLDFLVHDPKSGKRVPVNSRFRRVRALWNQFTEAGRTSDVVAWWATWPAEPINGHLISDRVSYSLFDIEPPRAGAGATWPPGYFAEIQPRLVTDEAIGYAEVARFAEITPGEFRAARARIAADRATAYREPVNHLTKILAAARNYQLIALDLVGRGQADLTAVYYQGIDEVCHRFIHYAAPRLAGIDAEDVRRYGRVVERYYVHQDRLLGELLRAVAPETAVIVVADHGFVNGPDRPRNQTADIEGKPGAWHRPYGMLILSGPPFRQVELDTTSLLDISPTVLYLAGLPVPDDAAGELLVEAIRPEFRERFPVTTIATYEDGPFRRPIEPGPELAAAGEEMLEKLRALGYVGPSEGSPESAGAAVAVPETIETVTARTNLAGVLLDAGDLEGAERELLAALGRAPGYRPSRRLLFDLRMRQRRADEALRIAEELIAEPDPGHELFLARVANAYRAAGRAEEGIERLRASVEAGRWQLGITLSRLLMDGGDAEGAEQAAREVLRHDPGSEAAMATVFRLAQARGTAAALRPLLEAALVENDRSVMHLNWLAIVLEGNGAMPEAEKMLLRALEVDPDHGGSMANLGAFYGRHGRAAEAIPLLDRALEIRPSNLEARVNLGSALARSGDYARAIAEFEAVVESGHRSTAVFNALARAYGESGRPGDAAGWLRRSLKLDPDQQPIRRLLESLEDG